MLRIFRPRRVVEVGSGFSSALILDVNDIYLGQGTSLTVHRAVSGQAGVASHSGRQGSRENYLSASSEYIHRSVFRPRERRLFVHRFQPYFQGR